MTSLTTDLIKTFLFRFLLILCLFLSSFLLTYSTSLAQQAGTSITPASFDKLMDPGTEEQNGITIQNMSDVEQKYYLFVKNISGVKDGGVPIFAKSNDEKTGYELSDWISLSMTEVVIGKNESATVYFVVSVPENASPGSHFGGIFVSVDPPEIENSGASVGYQVASILDIRVSGEALEEASIRQFSTSKFLYGSPNVEFSVKIQNTGNVLVKPRGPLEIYNMLGNKVGNMVFNDKEAGVFPHDTREFSNIKWEGGSTGFGRYEAILSPVYGDEGSKKTMTSSVTFWILPMNIIGPALGVLGVILIVTFIFVRLYIRRSLQHLNQGRRIVRRRKRGGSSTSLLLIVVMLTVTALFLIVLLALFA
ncbi:MAG: DUF916 domain-containing protein [Candidatus Nomurabacteria bacterium]|nr:MAG: DUF916 domain-containing protein [Candidatus Nomurabacteria bacterium]